MHRRNEFDVGGKSAENFAYAEGMPPTHRRKDFHLRIGGRISPARRHFALGGKSAFGPRNPPSGMELVRRLRRQRIKIRYVNVPKNVLNSA